MPRVRLSVKGLLCSATLGRDEPRYVVDSLREGFMTTIVAVERADGVVFASDTRVSGGPLSDGWVNKVVRNGPFVFGAAGYLRAIQVLKYAKLPMPPEKCGGDEVDRFVTKELVPAVREAFEEFNSKDTKSYEGSIVLCSVSDRVYELTSDGAWSRNVSGVYAIGSGAKYALGALEAGAGPREAIRIASVYDSGTNSDVHIFEEGNEVAP